jgi:hypothetical protein
MKHASARAINRESALHGPRAIPVCAVSYGIRHESKAAIGTGRSFGLPGMFIDEAECQISIAEFMTGQERNENLE